MAELIVDGRNVLEPVNLKKNKQKIMRQRASVPLEVTLKRFKENVGIFRANAKGDDLNGLVCQLQTCFTEINQRETIIYDELDTIFNTVESIHKGSIEGIIVGVKSAQEAIKQSDLAIEQIKETLIILQDFKQKLEENTEHLDDIDRIWYATQQLNDDCSLIKKELNEKYKKTKDDINILKRFKEDIEKCKHIKNIDKMFGELKILSSEVKHNEEKYSTELKILEDRLKNTATKQQSDTEILFNFMDTLSGYEHLNDIDDIWSKSEEYHLKLGELFKASEEIWYDVSSNAKNIEELQKHKNNLGQIKHLDDVDNIWEKTESYSVRLKELKQQGENTHELVQANKISMDELTEYKSKLCRITHLNDIDDIWNSSQVHSGQLSELEKQSDETKSIVQTNKKNTDAAIASIIEKNNTAVQMLTKKIKNAYLLAGGSLGLAIIELIVILLKVL